MSRACKNHPNRFCYICGQVIFKDHESNITDFVKQSYYDYFKIKLGDQDKPFAPHVCCKTCVEGLRRWMNGTAISLPFGVPMVWREGKDHTTDCYFCMTNLEGKNHIVNKMGTVGVYDADCFQESMRKRKVRSFILTCLLLLNQSLILLKSLFQSALNPPIHRHPQLKNLLTRGQKSHLQMRMNLSLLHRLN